MEIDRRSFCQLILFSSGSLLGGLLGVKTEFLRPGVLFSPDEKKVTPGNSGFPGAVIPLDRNVIRRTGVWAG